MKANNPIIQINNLSKSFKDSTHAVKSVSLTVQKGQVISIIGPSGSGKSTLLRCINLMETPTSGEIVFNGLTLNPKSSNINQIRQKIGMVFQHFNLFPHLSVLKNITIALTTVLKKSETEANLIATNLLKKVGLVDKANSYPDELSGGQKQRIAIA